MEATIERFIHLKENTRLIVSMTSRSDKSIKGVLSLMFLDALFFADTLKA